MSTSTARPTGSPLPADVQRLADEFVRFLETGTASEGMFAPDLFFDFTMPLWRLQTVTGPDAVAIRRGGHPEPSRIAVRRLDPLPSGFLLEVEEFWDHGGQQWYCRELMRADVDAGSIVDLSVYCTGDWDAARVAEHARMVHLPRP
jgi:hypothetical protein